jgi:hypothetical protein
MGIATVGLGFLVLLAGRPLYPVFTGAVTFLAGAYLARTYLAMPSNWQPLIVFLLLAGVGIGAGFAFRRWYVYLSTFIAGGYLVYYMPVALEARASFASPALFGIVGAIFLIAMFLLFDVTLVVLSSLLATTMILQYLRIATISSVILFLILVVFGISAQFLILQYGSPTPD